MPSLLYDGFAASGLKHARTRLRSKRRDAIDSILA